MPNPTVFTSLGARPAQPSAAQPNALVWLGSSKRFRIRPGHYKRTAITGSRPTPTIDGQRSTANLQWPMPHDQ
eukprot:10337001-Lingulodinium_polyedra.AAC.1